MGGSVAIIPARGGSKGIPGKNILKIAGKPLIAWSIEHALNAKCVDSVWVSSDSKEILEIAKAYGAKPILRPDYLSRDEATSESAWLHAVDYIEEHQNAEIDAVIAMQATSPIRGDDDLDSALKKFRYENLDSLLSVTIVEDHFQWRMGKKGPQSVKGYDFKNRKRRQDLEVTFLENGSFYIFTPKVLRTTKNRLGGKIGFFQQKKHKMFQIDEPDDVLLCEAILNSYQEV